MPSTASKALTTAPANMKKAIWGIAPVSKAAISRYRQSIPVRTSGLKWWLLWLTWVCQWKSTTTKWHHHSMSWESNSAHCWKPAITCSSTNMSCIRWHMPMVCQRPLCQSQSLAIMVQACMYTSQFGQVASRFLPATNMLTCRKMHCSTLAASSSMPNH